MLAEGDVGSEVLAAVGVPPAVACARRVLALLAMMARDRAVREILPDAAYLLCEKAPEVAEQLTTPVVESLLGGMLEEARKGKL